MYEDENWRKTSKAVDGIWLRSSNQKQQHHSDNLRKKKKKIRHTLLLPSRRGSPLRRIKIVVCWCPGLVTTLTTFPLPSESIQGQLTCDAPSAAD